MAHPNQNRGANELWIHNPSLQHFGIHLDSRARLKANESTVDPLICGARMLQGTVNAA